MVAGRYLATMNTETEKTKTGLSRQNDRQKPRENREASGKEEQLLVMPCNPSFLELYLI